MEAVEASLERAKQHAMPDDSLAGVMRAAMIGHTRAVIDLLDRGVPVNAADPSGRTPLIEAVFGGHVDTVAELLRRGAEVNAQDGDGWTALMEAAAKGRIDIVKTLLASGADARLKNKRGWTALRATAKCNSQITRLLRNAAAD